MVEPKEKIRVLGIFPALLPTAIIYIIKPFSELVKTGKYTFEFALEPYVTSEQIRWSDVVLFCRNVEPNFRWILDEVIAQGKPCSYDLDDYFWEVPISAQFGEDFFNPHRVAQMEQYLRHVDLVRVFNRRLFEKTSQFNANSYQALPCIDMRQTPRERPQLNNGLINITYVTGRGAGDSLLPIISEDVGRILDCYPDKVRFTFWGDIPSQFKGHPSVDLMPILHDYDYYLQQLSSGKFDIGLAPLMATTFYLSKTNTKFRDYGASNIAGIYSNVDIYADCIEDGKNGLIVENRPGAWYDAMVRLIEDDDLRQNVQRQAYQDVYHAYRQELAEQEWEKLIDNLLKKTQVVSCSRSQFWTGADLSPQWGLSLGRTAQMPPGFIRVSPFWEPGVSVIADINTPLPFADHTFSAVITNHALAQVDSLKQTMLEVFRVSKDRAPITIYERYTNPSTAEAQPVPGIAFNEDTPRCWTDSVSSPIFELEYMNRGPSTWGAGDGQGMDFRCTRMEFFYTDAYLALRNEERRVLRRSQEGVCDQILYRLVIAKTPLSNLLTKQVAYQMDYFEPAEVTIRRLEDNRKLMFADYERASKELKDLQKAFAERSSTEASTLPDSFQEQINALQQALAEEQQKANDLQSINKAYQMKLEETNQQQLTTLEQALALEQLELEQALAGERLKAEDLKKEKETYQKQLEEARSRQEIQQQQLEMQHKQLEEARRLLEIQQQQVVAHQQYLDFIAKAGRRSALELGVMRNRKAFQLIRSTFDRADLRDTVGAAYKQMLDDSSLFNENIKGYLLQPSDDLQLVRSFTYRFTPGKPGLKRVTLLPVIDVPAGQGVIGIELAPVNSKIAAQVLVSADRLVHTVPVNFDFSPIPDSNQGIFDLRVFVYDIDTPVRLYEWRKYPLRGLLGVRRQPFLSLEFV